MEHLDIILILMAVLVVLYTLAEKIKLSYPILLVLAGLGISLIPELPSIQLSPEVVFLIFLPPLLFDAARHTSWHDFRKNKAPIGRLAIGLVLFTIVAVAFVAHHFIPGFSWALGFVLGAIVSPPDVVAATSATKGLRLPKRLITILEGESLVNDASALIAYRYAVAAVVSGTFLFWDAAVEFLVVAGGGVLIGVLMGSGFIWLQKKFLNNATVETCVTLMLAFTAYIFAEHLGVSGVLSVVTAGLFVSWRSHDIFSHQTRMQMNSFWDTLIFLLNGLVFILIGLQLPAIIDNAEIYSLSELIKYGLLISGVVIAVRMLWVYPTVYISEGIARLFGRSDGIHIDPRHLFVIGWAGMRGVVSLATAFALPLTLANGDAFPERNAILFITFVVILVTLVFQGLTLPLFVRLLKISETPARTAVEERRLRLAMAHAAQAFIEERLTGTVDTPVTDELKHRIERQINYLNGVLASEEDTSDKAVLTAHFRSYLESEQALIDNQREMLIQMHRKGAFSADVLRKIELDLDIWSMGLHGRLKAMR